VRVEAKQAQRQIFGERIGAGIVGALQQIQRRRPGPRLGVFGDLGRLRRLIDIVIDAGDLAAHAKPL